MLKKVLEKSSNKIVFNAETVQIKQDISQLVEVTARNTASDSLANFRAKRIICSVPITLVEKIHFQPGLPIKKLNVIRAFKMGHYGKVILTFKSPFWREKGFSGEIHSDGSQRLINADFGTKRPKMGPINYAIDATTYENHAALVVFLAGQSLVEWSGKKEDFFLRNFNLTALSCARK